MMALQCRIPVLPMLSRCSLLTRVHQISAISCAHWHHTFARIPYTRMVGWQRLSDHKFLQSRNFTSFFMKKKSPEKLRDDDNVESHYELVHSASSVSYVQLALGGVQAVVGGVCLLVGAVACGIPMTNAAVFTEEPIQVATFITVNFMICLGILRVCTLYPLRIYYSEVEDSFVVIFVGAHPLAVRHVKILPGDVKPSPPGPVAKVVVPWSYNLYTTPTQNIYLNTEHFKYPFYYNKMLGYTCES